MVSMKQELAWKNFILPVMGILAFLLYLFLLDIDLQTVFETIQHIDLSVYLLSILLVFIEPFLYALSWRSLLDHFRVKLPLLRAYLFVWYGMFMNIIVPAASLSGEVSKLYLVTRERSGTGGKVVATLVTQRLVGLGIILASLITGIVLVSTERSTSGIPFKLALLFAIGTTLFQSLFVLLCLRETWTLKIIDVVVRLLSFLSGGRWNLTKIKEDAIETARIFNDSMKEFRRAPKTLLTSTLFAVISWLSGLGIAYSVFLALSFHVQWSIILVTCSIVVVLPARGLPEIAMATIYTLLGVPPEIGATATILTRILTFWLRFFVGFAVQQWLEIRTVTSSGNTGVYPKV